MVGMIVFIFRQFILCEKKPPPLPEEQNAVSPYSQNRLDAKQEKLW